MRRITVNGAIPLVGEVKVSGSKNAALPIIFACITARGISEIKGLPDIGDVRVSLKILEKFGAQIRREGDFTYIDTEHLVYTVPDPSLISNIRASTYLIGSCLSRFGKCHILPYGGCNFSQRPIDMHIDACTTLGAAIEGDKITAKRLCGAKIHFNKKSVGATVNALLLSATAYGDTVIEGAASEPHIDALVDFLRSAGANISRQGDSFFVKGSELHGGKIAVIGDMIEAGSYLAAGLITDGRVRVTSCPVSHMDSILHFLRTLGAKIAHSEDTVEVEMTDKCSFTTVTASPYPGFPTDLQPIVAPLMAKFSGGRICDTVWRERFGYLQSLSSFGVNYSLSDFCATVGKSKIVPSTATSPDLRGGMACLLCALSAEGKSEIYSADVILRGYENLTSKLCAIGAEIKIE